MEITAIERIRGLIESIVEDTDDEERQFKLRTALQLLEYIEHNTKQRTRHLQTVNWTNRPRKICSN